MGRGRSAFLSAALVLVACGSGAGNEGSAATAAASRAETCPISPEGRRLLADFSTSTERELEVATVGLSAGGIDWATALVGAGSWLECSADLASSISCTGPRMDASVTCMSDLGGETGPVAGVDTCFAIGCEAADVLVVDVYSTIPPHRAPDDRVSISYASTPPYPSASVTYAPNPLTRWRSDATGVWAVLAQNPVVAFQTGETIDFTFNGQARASSGSFMTSVSFPRLTARGTVELTTSKAMGGALSGAVVLGDQTLAAVNDGGMVWQGACAD